MTLTREQLKWTERDTQIVEEHKRRVAEGKERCVDITNFTPDDMKRYMQQDMPANFWFCARCECFDNSDGHRKNCDCPCHRGSQAD